MEQQVGLISEYSLFLAKIITIIFIFLTAVMILANITQRKRQNGELRITRISEKYKEMKEKISVAFLNNDQKKRWYQTHKKKIKNITKLKKSKSTQDTERNKKKSRVFLIDFKGSIDAKEVTSLREEITAVLSIADDQDKVVLRLESAGGIIHGYGLAASQLQRLRDRNIQLIISVDKIAASGGYMMACVAEKIVAAPFSIVGSIGVVAQIPNLNRFLKSKDIDIELHTAGQYKRTLTIFGKNTEEGRKKFLEDLNETHRLFKDFIKQMRPTLDIEQVSTGEYWYGVQALEKGLIDEIMTSDDLILKLMETNEIIGVQFIRRHKFLDRFTDKINKILDVSLSSGSL